MDKPHVRWARRRRHKTGAPVDHGIPRCPICVALMTLRTNSATSQLFWGCRRFPRCRGVVEFTPSQANNTRLVWETKLYTVNGETVSVELAKAVPP